MADDAPAALPDTMTAEPDAMTSDPDAATTPDATEPPRDTGVAVSNTADGGAAACPVAGESVAVCGCGCCGGAPARTICFYPERRATGRKRGFVS